MDITTVSQRALARPRVSACAEKAPVSEQSSSPSASETVTAHDMVELSSARPSPSTASANTGVSKYDGFFATIVSAAVTGPTGGVAGLAAGKLMFHGTPARFDRVESRPSTRTSSGGKIDWQGEAIFAAFDPRIALFYTATRGTGVGTSVNLREITSPDQPLDIHLDGGANQAEALDLAYGRAGEESSRGYIHVLERSKFVREPGLGVMELITRDSDAQIGRLEIDRRKALDSLVASGDVNVRWSAE